MSIVNTKEPAILFIGDILVFIFSLWLMLFSRYLEIPSQNLWNEHIIPFSILFVIWFASFYIAGLYEKHTLILKKSLSNTLFNTQVINVIIAVLFFYFVPYFAITPKTNLFIYLIISFSLVVLWRLYIFNLFSHKKRQNAILIGSGEEIKELRHEVNNNGRYDFQFIESIDLDNYQIENFKEDIINKTYQENVSLIVADIKNPVVEKALPSLYNLIFANVQFMDTYKLYERLFDKIPLSLMSYSWFLENVSSKNRITYDILKRLMDFSIALILGIISILIYPFLIVFIKLEDRGSVFYFDERLGKDGKIFKVIKFRSMSEKDGGEKSVTKIGKFLRKTRLDEIPQLWNVIKGELSLIGPRPERPDLVSVYKEQVPFYNVRHLIKPGLSGWAQMKQEKHPHHGADTEATKEKLSYDLYYIKNRSFLLDLKIALQTLQLLISRKGK